MKSTLQDTVFKPKVSADARRQTTEDVARSIIESERAAVQAQSEKLRALRLARDAELAATATKKSKSRKPA